MEKKLDNIIEGILFVSGDSVELAELADRLCVSIDEVNNSIESLKEKFDGCINILQFDGKVQFATSSKYQEDISAVLTPIKEREFSQSMIEVASIVAYKQPITRQEIELVRGVSSEYAINALLKQNIVEIVGKKDALGRPYLFGTTENFLKKFNLTTISELPNYEEFVEKLNFNQDEKEEEDGAQLFDNADIDNVDVNDNVDAE